MVSIAKMEYAMMHWFLYFGGVHLVPATCLVIILSSSLHEVITTREEAQSEFQPYHWWWEQNPAPQREGTRVHGNPAVLARGCCCPCPCDLTAQFYRVWVTHSSFLYACFYFYKVNRCHASPVQIQLTSPSSAHAHPPWYFFSLYSAMISISFTTTVLTLH